MPMELLLIDRDTGRSVLQQSIDERVLSTLPGHYRPARPLPSTADADSVWTVVYEDSERGDRIVEAIEPLIQHRRDDHDVQVVAIPDVGRDHDLIEDFRRYADIDLNTGRPDHVLIVGDLPAISLEVQHELAEHAYVGRLCFTRDDGRPDLDGYRSYCDKVITAETTYQAPRARSMFYCSRGDPVSEQSYGSVVRRSWRTREDREFAHRFTNWAKLAAFEEDSEGPAILFSMCHGAYEPEATRQRARQGGLVLQEAIGAPYQFLFANQFADRRFLADGFWFMMTCYSAATPDISVYSSWLEQLTSVVPQAYIDQARNSLAVERPFVARLPQVVLANPEGPLGVLGHADMTWSMGYNEHRLDRRNGSVETVVGAAYNAYAEVVTRIAEGTAFGVAARGLLEFLDEDDEPEQAQAASFAEIGQADMPPKPEHKRNASIVRALRHMRYLDRRCYILLGDPAARLQIAG